MQEFIENIAKQLGINEAIAKQATSVIVGFIKSKLADGDFGDLASKIPGLSDLADAQPSGDEGGGGLLGGVMKMASSAIGGEAGDALELTGKLKDTGLDVGQMGSLGSGLIDFIKDKAGDGAVDMITSQMPELKKMLS